MTFLWGFLAGVAVAGPLGVLAVCLLVMRKRADKAAAVLGPFEGNCTDCGRPIRGWFTTQGGACFPGMPQVTTGKKHYPMCPK